MATNCCCCNKLLAEIDVIKTDEFKEFGSEVKKYCSTCFLENVKIGFGKLSTCDTCGSSLILKYDNDETISLAQDDYTVHFICEKVKEAAEKGNETEIDRLEKEEHDWLILYTIQPEPNTPDFGLD